MSAKLITGLILLTLIFTTGCTLLGKTQKDVNQNNAKEVKIKIDPCVQFEAANCPAECAIKMLGTYDAEKKLEYFSEKCVSK